MNILTEKQMIQIWNIFSRDIMEKDNLKNISIKNFQSIITFFDDFKLKIEQFLYKINFSPQNVSQKFSEFKLKFKELEKFLNFYEDIPTLFKEFIIKFKPNFRFFYWGFEENFLNFFPESLLLDSLIKEKNFLKEIENNKTNCEITSILIYFNFLTKEFLEDHKSIETFEFFIKTRKFNINKKIFLFIIENKFIKFSNLYYNFIEEFPYPDFLDKISFQTKDILLFKNISENLIKKLFVLYKNTSKSQNSIGIFNFCLIVLIELINIFEAGLNGKKIFFL